MGAGMNSPKPKWDECPNDGMGNATGSANSISKNKPIRCVAYSYKGMPFSNELFERFTDSLEACGYVIVEERRHEVRIDHRPGTAVTYYVWRFESFRPDADLTKYQLLDKPAEREIRSKPYSPQ